MKKLVLIIMAMALVMPATVSAQNKTLEKALKKEYKSKMKEYKKEGWKIFGTSRSLDVALLKHYEKLDAMGDDGMEVVGTAKFKSKNVGNQMALNNACNEYARMAGSHVKGRIVGDMASDGVDPEAEFDKFYAAYEAQVEKEIKGEMQKSYSVIRELGNGTFEMQTFFIVNESAASKARIRAYENAAKESAAAQKYASKVSEFIKEGFKAEQE